MSTPQQIVETTAALPPFAADLPVVGDDLHVFAADPPITAVVLPVAAAVLSGADLPVAALVSAPTASAPTVLAAAAPAAAALVGAAPPAPVAAVSVAAATPVAAARAVAAPAAPRSAARLAAFSHRQLMAPVPPPASCPVPVGKRKKRIKKKATRLFPSALCGPSAAAASVVFDATAATPSAPAMDMEAAPSWRPEAEMTAGAVADTSAAVVVDTTAGVAGTTVTERTPALADAGAAARAGGRGGERGAIKASTAGSVLASEGTGEYPRRGRRIVRGGLDTVKRQETVAAECGVFRRMATAATGAAAGCGGTRRDSMSVAAGAATRVAIAAAAGATAARVVEVTAAWGAAAAAEGDRVAGEGGARGWMPGRGRNGEETSPVGLLRLLPFSFSPWGVLFGIVVVAMFHVCLFWGASWFFSKHLFREYQQKRLSVQHLFAFTFTVCVAMLQLLLLELLHVLHPTLRRWVWHGDLVCVLLLLYLILPVSIVYNLVVRSPPSDAADAAAAAAVAAAAAASSCTGAGVALSDVEQPEEEEETAETGAENSRRAAAAGAASEDGWNAATAAPLGYAAATMQRRRRRGRGSRNRGWEALVSFGKGKSFLETTREETAAAYTAEQQQQGYYTIVNLGMTVVRWWCGRRRNCSSSVCVKEQLLPQLQHRTEEEEEEAAVEPERYGGQQIVSSLAAAAALAAPDLPGNHSSALSAPYISAFAATAAPPPPRASVACLPPAVDAVATGATPHLVSPPAAATAATGCSAVASGAEVAGGALSGAACLSPSCAVLNARRLSSALLARRGRELPCSLQRWQGQQQHGDTWSLEQQRVQQEVEDWSLQQSQTDGDGRSAVGLLHEGKEGRGIVWSRNQEEPPKSCGGHQQEMQQPPRGTLVRVEEQQSARSSSCRRERALEQEQLLSPAAWLSLRMAMAGDGLRNVQNGSGGECGSSSYSERSRRLCLVFAICCVMLPLLWMCFYQSGRLLHLDPAAVASLSFMECLLAYVGICGVTVVSALAGFGSVNFPYRILFASFSKISQSQVEELEQRLLHTLSLIAEKKKKTQKLQQAASARKTAARCCFWLSPCSSSCRRKDSSRRKDTAVATPQHLHALSGSHAASVVAVHGEELQLQHQRMPQREHQCTDSSHSISMHPQQQLLQQQQVLQQLIQKGGGEGSESTLVTWTQGGLPNGSCGPTLRDKPFNVQTAAAAADFAAIAIQRQQEWGRRIDETLDDDRLCHSASAAELLTLEHQAQGMGLRRSQPSQLEKQQQRQHLLQEHRQQSSGLCASAEEETGTPAGNSGSTFFSRLLNRGGSKSGGGCTYTRLVQQQVMSGEPGEQKQQLRTGTAAAGPLKKFKSFAAAADALALPSQRQSGCGSRRCRTSGLTGLGDNSSTSGERIQAEAGRMEGVGSGSSNSSSEDETRWQTSTEILQDEEKSALSLMERGFACSSSSRNRDNSSVLEAEADNRCSSWGLSRRWKESTKGKWRSNSGWKDSHRRQQGMSSHGTSSKRDEEQEGTGLFEWLRAWRGFFAEGVTVPVGRGNEEATAEHCGIEPLAAAEAGVMLRRGARGNAAAGDRHVGGRSLRTEGKRWKNSRSRRAPPGEVCSGGGGAAGRRGWLPWRVWSWACGVLQQQQQGQQWLWAGVGGTNSKKEEREEGAAQQQHLQSEITALEELSRELFVALDNLVQSRAQALYRETVVGRLHSLLAWIMTGVCIFRVGSAGFNVLCGRSSAGVGSAGAAPVPQADPATRVLEAVLQQLQVPVNVAAVSPYLSLLLLSCIIALTIRNFVEKLLTVFRHVSTSSVWTANVLALVMAEIMGFYFSACVLLTRVYLPQAYQDAVTQVLAPSLDFRVFHLHFDRVFLVSCLASFAVILFSHKHVTEKLKSL